MSANPLIFDVETIADITDDNRETIASFAKGRDMAAEEYATFCPPLARVVCISWLDAASATLGAAYDTHLPGSMGTLTVPINDGSDTPRDLLCTGCAGESEVLREFGSVVTRHFQKSSPALVTYSGRNFDLPVLIHRSIKHGVAEGRAIFNKAARENRFNPQKHFDLLDVVTFCGAGSRWPMATYAIGYGHRSPKDEMDGSKVAGAVASGRILDVVRYCAADVIATAQIYRRLADSGLIVS